MMKTEKWRYYSPDFESDHYNPEMMIYAPWSGHRMFAYDYIANVRPGRVVELGSHYGCSAFAFLQAVKDFKLDTEFYGVDTWCGDAFTKGDYREDIFGNYKNIQESCFSDQKAVMMRMTFDAALGSFEDESVDLLHIDGSHLYEDVKHDFETWRKKVKSSGVVFFHDIGSDEWHGKKMGSHIFWEELKESFPFTYEFSFSIGLGILFFEPEGYHFLADNIDKGYYQQLVNINDTLNKDRIRRDYFEIRDLNKYTADLKEQVKTAQIHLKKYSDDEKQKECYIRDLEKQVEDITGKCRSTFEESRNSARQYADNIGKYKITVQQKEKYIEELENTIEKYKKDTEEKAAYIKQMEAALAEYGRNVEQKDNYISRLEKRTADADTRIRSLFEETQRISREYQVNLDKYEKTVSDKERYINELTGTIDAYGKEAEGKEKYISELSGTIEQYKITVEGKEKYISELQQAEEQYKNTVRGKEKYISELKETVGQFRDNVKGKEKYIGELKETVLQYEKEVRGKEDYISELKEAVGQYEKNVQGKEDYISELKAAAAEYEENVKGKERYILELKGTVEQYRETVKGKDNYISELQDTIEQYRNNVAGKESYIEELEERLKVEKREYRSREDALYRDNAGLEASLKQNGIDLKNSLEKELSLQEEIKALQQEVFILRKRMEKLPFGRYALKETL